MLIDLNNISIRFSDETESKFRKLKEILGEDNNAQVLAEGISIYLELLEAVKLGNKILFEDSNGDRFLVRISRGK